MACGAPSMRCKRCSCACLASCSSFALASSVWDRLDAALADLSTGHAHAQLSRGWQMTLPGLRELWQGMGQGRQSASVCCPRTARAWQRGPGLLRTGVRYPVVCRVYPRPQGAQNSRIGVRVSSCLLEQVDTLILQGDCSYTYIAGAGQPGPWQPNATFLGRLLA